MDANAKPAVVTPSPFSSDGIFRLLVDQITDYAIFLLTPEGEVATWNPGAKRIKGYRPEEIIGKHFRNFYPPEAQKAQIPEEELKIAAANGRFEDEGWRIRNDGSSFWASVIITAIRDSNGNLLGYGKVTRDLTERRRAEVQLRELSHSLLKSQDQERRRLGRELHDSVGQHLAAAKMTLDLFAKQLVDRPRNQLNECLAFVDRAIREVRTISYLLYPPMLEELGLASAIRWHLEGFSNRSGIDARVERCDDVRLPEDAEVALFRILQEALTNVHRHSHSKTARVRFMVEDHSAILEVRDEGTGLPASFSHLTPGALGQAGVGLRGMYERICQLGGELGLSSTPQGTTVTAMVPLPTPTSPK